MAFSDISPVFALLDGSGVALRLFGVPCLEDNLAWGLADAEGHALLVDVPEAAPVDRFLRAQNLKLDRVLITHGHRDHTAGLKRLLQSHPAEVLAHSRLGLPASTPLPNGGGSFSWRGLEIRIMDTSGHSDCDTSFYMPAAGVCFCGDTLFAGGCGRLFAGPPERMWDSLLKLRALPDDTLLCFGHDYALENYRFATQCFPEMPVFAEGLRQVETAGVEKRIYAPVTVGEQSRRNPMLMADHPEIIRALGLDTAAPEDVFAEIRSRRSGF